MKQLGQSEVITIILVVAIVGFIAGLMAVLPTYKVWQQEMEGKAELAKAEYSKMVSVQTARAKNDSAKYEAEAEVTRAYGVAKANNIIGSSLRGNEAYLRYLWINGLSGHNGETIYVPTEAGLPILEASRFNKATQ